MKCKLGFSQTVSGELLVVTEFLEVDGTHAGLSVTPFKDEALFLPSLIQAELDADATTMLISNLLLILAGRPEETDWVSVELHPRQIRSIGLALPPTGVQPFPDPVGDLPSDADLRDLMTQAPMPVTMMMGPEHEFVFINDAYVRLLGRNSPESVLGKSVREALPELRGQAYFGLLDTVYKTGEQFVGRELPGQLRNEANGTVEDFFFDFVYHPVRDRFGRICGILCQASDVTERVLARQVSEERELRLYQQWAELEAIYKGAPVGMALVAVKEYRVLRINWTNAQMLGLHVQELVGRKIFDLFPELEELREIYQRVAAGEEIRNVQLDLMGKDPHAPVRSLLVYFSPVLDACGYVEAIASITLDYAEMMGAKPSIVLKISASIPEAGAATNR